MIEENKYKLSYIQDTKVDESLDKKIRSILTECFPKEPKFITQRFNNEPPKHRWYIEHQGRIIAHLAAHEKEFETENKRIPFIGIAEVCIRSEFRGQKLVSQLILAAEKVNPEMEFSLLLGNPDYYKSSGYRKVNNVFFPEDSKVANEGAMVKDLKEEPFPAGAIIIKGLPF